MLHRRFLIAASVFCVLALALPVLLKPPAAPVTGLIKTPHLLPSDIVFTDDTGTRRSLEAFKGKPVLVNFWATWCVPCRRELPILLAMQKKYPGIAIIALSVDVKGFETTQTFFEASNTAHPSVYWDANMAAFRSLGQTGLPVTLAVTPEGKILGYVRGEIDWLGEAGNRIAEAVGAGRF